MPVIIPFGQVHFMVKECLNCFFVLSFIIEISVPHTLIRFAAADLSLYYLSQSLNGLIVYPKKAIIGY